MDYVVQISEHALMQMHLAALESYFSPPSEDRNFDYVETIGLLWGHEIRGGRNDTLYSIQHVSIDLNATREEDGASLSDADLLIKKGAVQSFWPHLDFLGDFHTHPHDHYATVAAGGDWAFSRTDYAAIENQGPYWMAEGYRVGLVMTVARLGRRSSKAPCPIAPHAWEWTLGDLRFWLAAYVAVPVHHPSGHFEGVFVIPRDTSAPTVNRRIVQFAKRQSVHLDVPRLGGFRECVPFKGTAFAS